MSENSPKKYGWGGARPGAGRKVVPLSQSQLRKLLRRAKKDAKEHGGRYHDVLFWIIRNPGARDADRIAAIKHLDDLLIPKISEGGEADKALGPAVYLPEHRPVLSLVDSGKSA